MQAAQPPIQAFVKMGPSRSALNGLSSPQASLRWASELMVRFQFVQTNSMKPKCALLSAIKWSNMALSLAMITRLLNACFTVCDFRSLNLKDALVLVSKAARIKTETKSFLDKDLQIIFAVGQTYSVNP